MVLLDKIGLGRKKKDLKKEAFLFKRNSYVRIVIFLLFVLVSVFSLPRSSVNTGFIYIQGQPWRFDDLTAPFTFSLNKTPEEITTEEAEIKSQIPLIFEVDINASIAIQTRLDSLYRRMHPVFETYHELQLSKKENSPTLIEDSLRFVREYSLFNIVLPKKSLNILLDNYHEGKTRDLNYSLSDGVIIKTQLERLIDELLHQGIIDQNKISLQENVITVINRSESTERIINIAKIRDLREANEFADFQLNQSLNEERAQLAIELYKKVIRPNLEYNEELRQQRISETISNISLTKGAMAQGQVIIRRGDIVTSETVNILESLNTARSITASKFERWTRFSGGIIIIIVISLVFYIYIYLYRRNISVHNKLFLLVFLTMGLISVTNMILVYLEISSAYVIPVAIAPIILTIIFDSRVGIMATITLASLIGLVHSFDFEYTISTFVACSMGVFSVRDIRNRSQFFLTTPGIVFLTYILSMGAFSLSVMEEWEIVLQNSIYIAINCLFILFTYPIILLFEKIFGITTDFTLLELGDTNQPLLKELMLKAPGTFHHSLQVANLSEAAASAVNANPLLVRVGAMYHDIGKMIKPEYFVENQAGESNEHDKLKPQMSAMVIKSHVSEGVKMAKEYNLPKVLISFIETHHGTSVIRYFFEKAKAIEEEKDTPTEETFRYDGPLPSTKETGILLLADGIEAASRAMKNPTYNKLENLVNRVVDDRMIEGQLSNCPLTFNDLQVIKETFINIQVGVYHSRIEYPDEQKTRIEMGEKTKKSNLDEGLSSTNNIN